MTVLKRGSVLKAARALRRLAETLEAAQVDSARRPGRSWQEIADALPVSEQAVHQRHARRPAQRVRRARHPGVCTQVPQRDRQADQLGGGRVRP